jgi:hypothetical protein
MLSSDRHFHCGARARSRSSKLRYMIATGRRGSILRLLWTAASLATALPIVGMVLGGAAWGGVNAMMITYLLVSMGSFLGLFSGLFAAFSKRTVLSWVTCLSGAGLALMSLVLSYWLPLQPSTLSPTLQSLLCRGRACSTARILWSCTNLLHGRSRNIPTVSAPIRRRSCCLICATDMSSLDSLLVAGLLAVGHDLRRQPEVLLSLDDRERMQETPSTTAVWLTRWSLRKTR